MKEIIVSENESGKKVFALIIAHLPKAPSSIIHKSIRNKNIVLNGKKTKEDEKVVAGDVISVYFSDETFDKFSANEIKDDYIKSIEKVRESAKILYEDEDIIAAYKRSGLLSQKSKDSDISINEILIAYLLKSGSLSEEKLKNFRPGIANRLDRNTSGIVLFGKTLKGLQFLNEGIKNRTIHKFYKACVVGECKITGTFDAYLIKNEAKNTVSVFDKKVPNSERITTRIVSNKYNAKDRTTDVEIELLTGKSHQIRAYMASIGYPLVGDPKYGNAKINKSLHLSSQMLVAYKVVIDQMDLEIKIDGNME